MFKRLKEKFRHNEEGSVLIMALLLMAVMSVIGVTSSMVSRTEVLISHNTKVSRQAFYIGDSGVEFAPKVISSAIDEGTVPDLGLVQVDANLRDEIMGYTIEAADIDSIEGDGVNPDLSFDISVSNFRVDIDRDPTGAKLMPGGGVQFASGAEGVGAGTLGGILIYYDIWVAGNSQNSARSRIDARYRKVVGVAGGT